MKKPAKKAPSVVGVDSDLPLHTLPGMERRALVLDDGTELEYDETCGLMFALQEAMKKVEEDPGFIGKKFVEEATLPELTAVNLWAVTRRAQKEIGLELTAVELMSKIPLKSFKRVCGEVSEILEHLNPNEEGAEGSEESSPEQ